MVTAERVRDYKPSLAHFRYFARFTGASTQTTGSTSRAAGTTTSRPRGSWRSRRVWLDRDRTGEDPASASAYVQSAADVPDAVARLWADEHPAIDRGASRSASWRVSSASSSLFPDDETVWRTLPGVPNSAGNLALHVAGNLQHFVGAVLGGSAYVRDEDGGVFAPVGIAARDRRGTAEGRRRRADRAAEPDR